MFSIHLKDIGKRFNHEWIFRKINYEFTEGNHYAILGSNGSGKSTLLQLISGNVLSSEGKVTYQIRDEVIPEENIFSYLSFAAPYLELFEEFTLVESIDFQAQFKPFCNSLTTEQIVETLHLGTTQNKQLKYYSSGMKQKVRLALAILSNTPLLLLDEPTSNLDKKAIDWYQKLVKDYSKNRLIIVCSNQQEHEYVFCNKQLHIENYK